MDASSAPVCAPTADAAFGPLISDHCRGGFDFTLVFEQSIFVLAPGCVLLLLAPFRLAVLLRRAPHLAKPGKLRVAKLVSPIHTPSPPPLPVRFVKQPPPGARRLSAKLTRPPS